MDGRTICEDDGKGDDDDTSDGTGGDVNEGDENEDVIGNSGGGCVTPDEGVLLEGLAPLFPLFPLFPPFSISEKMTSGLLLTCGVPYP